MCNITQQKHILQTTVTSFQWPILQIFHYPLTLDLTLQKQSSPPPFKNHVILFNRATTPFQHAIIVDATSVPIPLNFIYVKFDIILYIWELNLHLN